MSRRPLLGALAFLLISAPPLPAQSAQALQQSGIRAFRAGNFAEAQRLFAALVEHAPSAAAFSYLAAAEDACGEYTQAIKDLKHSRQLGNDSPDLHYDLALAYLKLNQPAAGIREFRTALARAPGFAAARYALGVALLQTGHSREALRELEHVKQSFAKSPGMWVNLAHARFAAGNTASALAAVKAALQALPGDSRLTVALAGLCLSYHQPQEARQLLEDASEAAPGNNRLKLLLAEASLKAEEPAEALAVLKGVPPQTGATGQVDFLRGSALMLQGKRAEAGRQLGSAIAARPDDVVYLSTYAELETSQENYPGALETLARAARLQPRDPEFPYQMALVYVFMHRYADAEKACRAAFGITPDYSQAFFLLGAIDLDHGAAADAVAAFRRAVALKPASALYHSALGAALFRAEESVASENELDRALHLDPKTASAYYWRAEVLARRGAINQAFADLQTFIALDPRYPAAWEALAKFYSLKGERAKAGVARAKFAALKQKSPDEVPFFLAQLGITRFHKARTAP